MVMGTSKIISESIKFVVILSVAKIEATAEIFAKSKNRLSDSGSFDSVLFDKHRGRCVSKRTLLRMTFRNGQDLNN